MLCFIPYCSVGVPNGQLLGIRTDQMQLILTTKEGNSYRLNGRITLAITPQTIHPQGAYHGILNPAILTELNHRAKPEIPVWNEIKKGA